MDLTEFRDLLMLDLKMVLDTDVSTAEANRCIFRAVDDLSRHLPRERIYETTYKNVVTDNSFVAPAAQSDTTIVNGISISSVSDGSMATLTTNWFDIPRQVKVTIVDSNDSITRMTLIVKGRDADGVYREERFYRHNGKVQTGKVYFLSFMEIEINEISGNGAGDTLSVGSGAITGLWMQLSNPIEPGTESIYSAASKAGTKYKLDTDYEMDYANGRITLKSGGSMVAGDTYYANYDKSSLSIDISEIIPVLTRITKVLYPADKIPEQSVAFSIWENMMTIGSQRTGESQKSLSDGDHIAIYYEMRHGPPTETGSGSYPELLDQVVAVGAAGYVLLMEALQYELQAVTDLAEIRTTLDYLGVGTDSPTFLYKLADDALDKVTLYLETNDTTDNAKDVLANITDDITNLRTAISSALDDANSELDAGDFSAVATHLTEADLALDKVTTFLENNTSEDSKFWLTKITTDITSLRTAFLTSMDAMNSYLDDVDAVDLGQATVGAEGLLETGDGLINQLNDGESVPALYSEYAKSRAVIAQARTQAAIGYAQEASVRLSNLRSYIEQAAGWGNIATGYINEASQRIAMAAQITNRETGIISQANGYVNEAMARLDNLRGYIEEATGWIRMGETFAAEAQSRIAMMDRVLAEAGQYQEAVANDMLLADRFRAEGQIRLAEFNSILSSKAEYRKRVVDVAVRQPK